jgi:hypothetical protein
MPFFEVRMHIRGIEVPFNGERASGFFANRIVRAPDITTARVAAVRSMHAEWQAGPHAEHNRGGQPIVEPESVVHIGLLRGVFGRKQGYVFYPMESPS